MGKVLVVDDSSAIRLVVSDFLAFAFDNISIIEAADGVAGWEQVVAQHPDLILLDAEMPIMNGLELARQVRDDRQTQAIPIVAISSGADDNPTVIGLRQLSDAILPKPFTPDDLIQLIGIYASDCVTRV